MPSIVRQIITYFGIPFIGGVTLLLLPTPEASARPQYLKQFATSYPKLNDSLRTTKCNVCHGKASKKDQSAYGAAVAKALGTSENEKDLDVVAKALLAAEKSDSSEEGKTFGDQIKAGQLPQ